MSSAAPPPPAPTQSHSSNFALLQILAKDKFTGTNYLDWSRSLRITLRYEKKEYVLDKAVPDEPGTGATPEDRRVFEKHRDHSIEVACLMLATMSPELQKQFEHLGAYDMNIQLKDMFQDQAKQERFDVVKAFINCKHQEGTSVCTHVRKMKAYLDRLELLSVPLPQELAMNIVLSSLADSYHQFVMNYNMNNLDKTLMELHGMLKTAEASMILEHFPAPVLAIREGNNKKRKANTQKGKGKGKVATPAPKKKAVSGIEPSSDPSEAICFYCQDKGHWKRDCPKLKEDKKKNKAAGAGSSGVKEK